MDIQQMKIPTLLIIDDEAGWRSLYRFELEGDYQILEAGDGLEAMAVLQAVRPDLIILDLMMPGMNGFSFLQELEQRVVNIPVILSTAVPLGEDPCYLMGHQVVAKSTKLKSLRCAIERLLERSEQGQPA
ncbi:MAG TPA: response regulator [Methylomirabilota bacterium]|nr:response regulator [Methylomirabilota bacterium]